MLFAKEYLSLGCGSKFYNRKMLGYMGWSYIILASPSDVQVAIKQDYTDKHSHKVC